MSVLVNIIDLDNDGIGVDGIADLTEALWFAALTTIVWDI